MNLQNIISQEPQISLSFCSQKTQVLNVLNKYNLWTILKALDPYIVGTFPINLQLPGSDLDILCHSSSLENSKAFADEISQISSIKTEIGSSRGHDFFCCSLKLDGLPIEIFMQNRPGPQQDAFKHMIVEAELLIFGGPPLRKKIMSLKQQGIKTEPAFAQVLKLPGDPYLALLDLEQKDSQYKENLVKNT